MNSHSQFGEDAWLVLNPPFDFEGAHTFCEVGAFDGVQSSNTLLFEEMFGWTGLLIEPNPRQWEKCRVNRKAPSICIAISDAVCGDSPFFINELDEGQSNMFGRGEKTTPITQLYTALDRLWKCFYRNPPSLLSIDTEGSEFDVMRSCGDMRPEIVIMEYLTWGMPSREGAYVEGMGGLGYTLMHRTEANLIFTR